ncbi:MAG TPA: tRNA (adenosine(37)-N6)-threonylcarbamoyltransferase complex dimerization subunit type 1 TsaB [Pyrinomonadaceae bacterium]|nr:tRNA (adenosine(37)-N6)-threonylcarbamoyltransferase complex dimerization subunit type 1 TsaB [Pyrinomonadaceae bacterium]
MLASTEKSEPLILAIETATRSGGVAVARGEQVLAARAGDATVSHSMNLIEMIEEALQEAGVKLSEVDLFAVAEGPGSFTGLRIGLATAKAFAAHLNRKVAGVSTLAAVAHASGANGEVIALLPAGRGEVFAQRFSVNGGNVAAMDEARHLSPSAVTEQYGEIEGLTLAGEGAQIVTPPKGENSNWIVMDNSRNLAPSIALLGLVNYREGKPVAPEDLRAVYVRASDAEINEQWLRQKAQQPTQV